MIYRRGERINDAQRCIYGGENDTYGDLYLAWAKDMA